MNKSILNIFFFLSISCSIFSQTTHGKTATRDTTKSISNWQITDDLGTLVKVKVDTVATNYQNTATDQAYSIANAYCGNLGSPLQSKIYFDRTQKSDFIFMDPYNSYYQSVNDYRFFNTKTPYSNIAYYTAGPAANQEERFKALFAVNVNPKFNMGFIFDYIYGRGIYLNQSTNHMTSGVFASYTDDHYSFHTIASLNHFRNYENGGIQNDLYITNPQQMSGGSGIYDPQNIEVNFDNKVTSELRNTLLYFNHQYRLGFEKRNEKDSSKMDFIPVTTFIHTIKFETDSKGYTEDSIPKGDTIQKKFYKYNYIDPLITSKDTAYYQSLKNTVAISLNEEFNTIAHFGLTAFLSNDMITHKFLKEDASLGTETENNTSVGGILSKQLGTTLKYEALAELYVLGRKSGNFELSGKALTNIRAGNDSIIIAAKGYVKNTTPDFFLDYYESNHFQWNNNFSNEYKTHLGGELAIPTRNFKITANVENLNNFIYFNNDALPAQYKNNLQVLAFDVKKDFALWHFHLENEVVYQTSSNQNILPLPKFSFYSNLYYVQKLFKVLTMQVGTDVHYNTEYYAPNYMPATGQFFVQNETKIGNYPLINVYANFHLKRMRFFIMYYHANYNISQPNYFSMPNYPMNPSMVKMGISWNFYD